MYEALRDCGWHDLHLVLGEEKACAHKGVDRQVYLPQRLLHQYLYFCTSDASKLIASCRVSSRVKVKSKLKLSGPRMLFAAASLNVAPAAEEAPATCLACQCLYFCTFVFVSTVSTWL